MTQHDPRLSSALPWPVARCVSSGIPALPSLRPSRRNIRAINAPIKMQISPRIFLVALLTASLRAGEIHDAAAAGDLARVKALLAADPTLLETKDNDSRTPLNQACEKKRTAVANLLIDEGADVKTRNKFGLTPLHYAAESDLIKRLVAKGADINARNGLGFSPLSLAMGSSLDRARSLIENGADPGTSDWRGPLLHQAVASGRRDRVEFLLKYGAKPDRRNQSGQTEMHVAAIRDRADLVPLLLDHGSAVDASDAQGRTALYYAAKHGLRRVADALVAGRANESGIVERNFGHAPQLAASLREGEAYLWFLGQDGYVLKTKKHLLIIDPNGRRMEELPEAGLANGRLNPGELAGQKIAVLFTGPDPAQERELEDPGLRLFELAKRMSNVDFVISFKPRGLVPPYHLAEPHQSLSLGDLKVHTIPALRAGVGYLVEVDGLKLFYAGYHVCNDASQSESYRKEIDFLKPFGPVDMVFLPVVGHMIPTDYTYNHYPYLLDQLSPKTVYLYHDRAGAYAPYAQTLRARHVWVEYPETASCGYRGGDRFHFVREQTGETAKKVLRNE
jgi:ankyrin repeat protein